ncbi:MAG: hypothetical protein ABSB14_10120 [Candidatus Sulfotelmatobacter sp.]
MRTAAVAMLLLAMLSAPTLQAQSTPPADPKSVTVIDAGIGACTADFTVNDADGVPVYAAKIQVHLTYGFMNLHKLDLEAGTNAAGKARFIGLPDKPNQGLFFRAFEGTRQGSAFDNPAKTCKANFTITLAR